MLATHGELPDRTRPGEVNFPDPGEVRLVDGKMDGPGHGDLAEALAAFANSRGDAPRPGARDETREVAGSLSTGSKVRALRFVGSMGIA